MYLIIPLVVSVLHARFITTKVCYKKQVPQVATVENFPTNYWGLIFFVIFVLQIGIILIDQ